MGILSGKDYHVHVHYLNSKGLRGRWHVWTWVQTGQHELCAQTIWWHLCARGHWEHIWVTHAPHESQAPILSAKGRAFPTSLMWVAIIRRKKWYKKLLWLHLCSKPALPGWFSSGIQPTYRTGITWDPTNHQPHSLLSLCHPTTPSCKSFLTVTTRWELWAGKSWSVLMSHWNMTQYTEVFYIYSLLEMLERQYNENTANKSSVFLLIWQ